MYSVRTVIAETPIGLVGVTENDSTGSQLLERSIGDVIYHISGVVSQFVCEPDKHHNDLAMVFGTCLAMIESAGNVHPNDFMRKVQIAYASAKTAIIEGEEQADQLSDVLFANVGGRK